MSCDMTTDFDARLEEYKSLRMKALDLIKRLDDLERNTILACTAIFVFGTTQAAPHMKHFLFALPTFVSAVAFVKYWGLADYLLQVNTYAASIEQELLGRDGWLTAYYSA